MQIAKNDQIAEIRLWVGRGRVAATHTHGLRSLKFRGENKEIQLLRQGSERVKCFRAVLSNKFVGFR